MLISKFFAGTTLVVIAVLIPMTFPTFATTAGALTLTIPALTNTQLAALAAGGLGRVKFIKKSHE